MVVDCPIVITSKVKPISRPDKTRKEEWVVQPVFCIVDTGSCLNLTFTFQFYSISLSHSISFGYLWMSMLTTIGWVSKEQANTTSSMVCMERTPCWVSMVCLHCSSGLNGLPPKLKRFEWFASNAQEVTMVCLLDEMHLATDGQTTAGTISSLLFLPPWNHLHSKFNFHLEAFPA